MEDYCKSRRFLIQPIGIGGQLMLSLQSVEVQFKIPENKNCEGDVMVSIGPNTKYGKRIPIQIGSQVIDQIVKQINIKDLENISEI